MFILPVTPKCAQELVLVTIQSYSALSKGALHFKSRMSESETERGPERSCRINTQGS